MIYTNSGSFRKIKEDNRYMEVEDLYGRGIINPTYNMVNLIVDNLRILW